MRGYGQYCPIALGAEVFAERWTPIILRNLMVGCQRFGEILDGAPGLPRSVLAQRLRRLERDGVIERTTHGRTTAYRLTDSGQELTEVVLSLGVWGARWRKARPEDHDPYLMLWTLTQLIDPDTLPRPRVVVRFDVTGHPTMGRLWLMLTAQGNEVCVTPPGFDVDGVVATDPAWLHQWLTGRVGLARAVRAGGLTVTAPRWLRKALTEWAGLNPFASVVPAVT